MQARVLFTITTHKILLHHMLSQSSHDKSRNAMRFTLFALIFMLTACETTRDNTITVKSRVKNMTLDNCNVPDRCGITP
jgi:hypothetical protein